MASDVTDVKIICQKLQREPPHASLPECQQEALITLTNIILARLQAGRASGIFVERDGLIIVNRPKNE